MRFKDIRLGSGRSQRADSQQRVRLSGMMHFSFIPRSLLPGGLKKPTYASHADPSALCQFLLSNPVTCALDDGPLLIDRQTSPQQPRPTISPRLFRIAVRIVG